MIVSHLTVRETSDKILFVGLSHRNLDLLRDNKPILITEESHPGFLPKGIHQMMIAAQPHEQDFVRLFKEHGAMDGDTKITRIPPES